MNICHTLLLSAFLLGCASSMRHTAVKQGHSHNDYEQARPLFEALDAGLCSVEADIHLANGELLVGHDPEDLRPGRTLESLYLAPLRARAMANGGRIHRGGPTVTLLIDIKTEAESTYHSLRELLTEYRDILTSFTSTNRTERAVTAVLSGNRPRAMLQAESNRLAGYDGRISDLGRNEPANFMPLVSDNWRNHFTWSGQGEISDAEREKLSSIVRAAHSEGKAIRFWASPDSVQGWRELRRAGVDLINTDQPKALGEFLRTGK